MIRKILFCLYNQGFFSRLKQRCHFMDVNAVITFVVQKPCQTHIKEFSVCLNTCMEEIFIMFCEPLLLQLVTKQDKGITAS